MSEEAIETQELKEKLDEIQEHAHAHGGTEEARKARAGSGHGREGASWITLLSLSTAVIAVLAAVAALESGSYANQAIVEKNDAVLHQSKADDTWAYYQAKGIEAAVYATQAELAQRPELGAKFRGEADREKGERAEIRRRAEEEEGLVAEMNEKSAHSLHVHHAFAKSVTIFQVAIALSAIAALARRKAMWWVSLAVGATGAAFFVVGLLAG